MASRTFRQVMAAEVGRVGINADISIGASGAPTLNTGRYVESVTRNGAGDYTIVLDDKYADILSASFTLIDSTAVDLTFQVTGVANGNKEITFVSKAAATETDPSDGARILVDLQMKNSSIPS